MIVEQLKGKYSRLRSELDAACALPHARAHRSRHIDRIANEIHLTEQTLWRLMPSDEQTQDPLLGFFGRDATGSVLPAHSSTEGETR